MYGWNNPGRRGNWATILIEKLRSGQKCQVVNDTMTQPLFNLDAAAAVWTAIDKTFMVTFSILLALKKCHCGTLPEKSVWQFRPT